MVAGYQTPGPQTRPEVTAGRSAISRGSSVAQRGGGKQGVQVPVGDVLETPAFAMVGAGPPHAEIRESTAVRD